MYPKEKEELVPESTLSVPGADHPKCSFLFHYVS